MKTALALLIVGMLLVGCEDTSGPMQNKNGNLVTVYHESLSGVYRISDNEAGVVCWVFNSYQKGGIDCMPISDTRLGE